MPPARPFAIPALALALAAVFSVQPRVAHAAKISECTRTGICYCVNDEFKAAITSKVERFRQILAEQRKAGKAVGYLSVPLTSAGGGNFNINWEVAESAKTAIEKRFGADFVYVLNPATLDADLPKGGGADYMLMWTQLLEGPDGLGDFDFVYFAGPQDFARYFGFDGNADMAKLDQYFDKRVKSDPDFEKAVQGGLTKPVFRRYYALRASSSVSRGAHDEWNIFRMINERRRADSKIGTEARSRCSSTAAGSTPRTPRRRCPRVTSANARRERAPGNHRRKPMIISHRSLRDAARAVTLVPLLGFALLFAMPARAADVVNAYSIWPENWARPMFEEFEKATGIKVNFVRFSSGEALARVIAEKNNPRVDVLFGGPVETFAAGIGEGVFESYKPPAYSALPPRFRHADGQWIAIADDPLVFMTNEKFLKEHGLKPPSSWSDLLAAPYKNMLQMADARNVGHRGHAHLLDPGSQRPRREQGVRLHEEAAA